MNQPTKIILNIKARRSYQVICVLDTMFDIDTYFEQNNIMIYGQVNHTTIGYLIIKAFGIDLNYNTNNGIEEYMICKDGSDTKIDITIDNTEQLNDTLKPIVKVFNRKKKIRNFLKNNI